MTENSKIDDLKEMLLDAENKFDIERSEESFEKSRSVGFEILKNVLQENRQLSNTNFKGSWSEGFRILRKILKEDL